MKRSRARKHYDRLIDAYGTPEERREEVTRPLGFARPQAVEARGPFPMGITSQAWEEAYEDD